MSKKTPDKKPETLPTVFDSMASCAAQTKIPLVVLKRAKKQGCPAFKWSRVNLLPLLEWIFRRGPDREFVNWMEQRTKFQAERERIKFQKEDEKSIDFESVRLILARGMAVMFSCMERSFELDLPPALKGLDEVGIQARLRAASESFKEAFRAELQKLTDAKPASPTKSKTGLKAE